MDGVIAWLRVYESGFSACDRAPFSANLLPKAVPTHKYTKQQQKREEVLDCLLVRGEGCL